jgi:hypothetical protein
VVLLAPLSAATQCYQVSQQPLRQCAAPRRARIQSVSQLDGTPSAIITCRVCPETNLIESKYACCSRRVRLRDEHQGPLAGPRPPAPGVQRLHVRHDRPLLGQRRRRLPDGQEEAQPESGRPHLAAARLAACPRHC